MGQRRPRRRPGTPSATRPPATNGHASNHADFGPGRPADAIPAPPRPAPPRPTTTTVGTADRVAVYAVRRKYGFALIHPGDGADPRGNGPPADDVVLPAQEPRVARLAAMFNRFDRD